MVFEIMRILVPERCAARARATSEHLDFGETKTENETEQVNMNLTYP